MDPTKRDVQNTLHDFDSANGQARREQCARILSSWDLLAWHSMNAQETIPQTRARFQRQMMGIPESYNGEILEGSGPSTRSSLDPSSLSARDCGAAEPIIWADTFRVEYQREIKERDARVRAMAKMKNPRSQASKLDRKAKSRQSSSENQTSRTRTVENHHHKDYNVIEIPNDDDEDDRDDDDDVIMLEDSGD